MIDDLTCFRLAPDRYWLFPTPSRVEAVLGALSAAQPGLPSYRDQSRLQAMRTCRSRGRTRGAFSPR